MYRGQAAVGAKMSKLDLYMKAMDGMLRWEDLAQEDQRQIVEALMRDGCEGPVCAFPHLNDDSCSHTPKTVGIVITGIEVVSDI